MDERLGKLEALVLEDRGKLEEGLQSMDDKLEEFRSEIRSELRT